MSKFAEGGFYDDANQREGYNNGGYKKSDGSNSVEDELFKYFDCFKEILNKIQKPTISEIEAQSVLVRLSPIELDSTLIKNALSVDNIKNSSVTSKGESLSESELIAKFENVNYTLELSSEANLFNQVYTGDANEITLKDLKPNTKYFLR